jgi:hypothetical protein
LRFPLCIDLIFTPEAARRRNIKRIGGQNGSESQLAGLFEQPSDPLLRTGLLQLAALRSEFSQVGGEARKTVLWACAANVRREGCQ